jgi:cysteine desulfurase
VASSCASGAIEPSHVLAAMGALTHGNVRVSLARETSEADVDRLLATLPGVLARLRPSG